ncbi:MAG TPA: hypothetical protein VLS88_09040 [Polyangiales bacterium]|nr:hypothetical protein [Polyangiales bacterium]
MKPKSRSLLAHEHGSMLLMSLFMSLFMVGTLYYVLGVGDAVLYRRVMQDGADSGAFAASVIAAKGMNLHVLLNVVMAITAGVLLVIRSVEVLLEIILAVLEVLAASILLAPKAVPLIGVLTPVESAVERIGDVVEEFVRVAHDALDVAHHAVQHGYPLLAEARAVDSMAFEPVYDPPVAAGFVLPVLGPRLPEGARGLPVEESGLGVTCDRVADALGGRLSNVRSKVPRWLLQFLGGVVSRALRLGKRRTCNEDVVEPARRIIGTREDGTMVWLGQEEFQYRAYSIGRSPHQSHWARGERGVRIAQGGGDRGRNGLHRAHLLGRIGIAQSEYYFDGVEGKAEWMWKQKWRARLRRFRVSRAWVPRGIVAACAGARGAPVGGLGGLCDAIRDFSLNAISAH